MLSGLPDLAFLVAEALQIASEPRQLKLASSRRRLLGQCQILLGKAKLHVRRFMCLTSGFACASTSCTESTSVENRRPPTMRTSYSDISLRLGVYWPESRSSCGLAIGEEGSLYKASGPEERSRPNDRTHPNLRSAQCMIKGDNNRHIRLRSAYRKKRTRSARMMMSFKGAQGVGQFGVKRCPERWQQLAITKSTPELWVIIETCAAPAEWMLDRETWWCGGSGFEGQS